MVPIAHRPESSEPEKLGLEPSQVPEDPIETEETRGPPTPAEVEEEIGREVLSILEQSYGQSYGKGAARAQTIVTDDWVIVVLDDLELLPNEQFLVDRGEQETVAHVRTMYQHAIQANFSAAIERSTGRRVIGFASTTAVEPPRFMAEVFKLE